MSPITERLTPASRNQADWVDKISKNGRPEEKPSASISARRGSLRNSRNRGDLRGGVMPEHGAKGLNRRFRGSLGRHGTALCMKEDASDAQAPRRAASPRSLRGPTSLVDGRPALSAGLGPEHAVAAALGPNSAVRSGAEWGARAGRSKIRAS